ncbi:MAG: peptidoglycan-binding protein, partial [Candidatus Competibacterales bacterium]
PPPPTTTPQGVEAQLNLSRSQRRQIQASLARRGFDPGPADGLLGPRSRRAIAAFQRTRGEEPTGYLNSTTGRALLEEAPPEGPGEVTPEPLATGSPDAETPPAVEPPPGDSDTATPPAPAPAPSPPAPRREVLLARIDALFVRGDYRGALAMARAALADNPNVSALGAWTRKLQQTLDRAEEANFRPSPPRSYQRDGAIQVQHAQCQQGDCINGKGVFNYSAGHIYKGEFRNAEPHGRGIYLDVTTGVRYVGDFHHGVAQGRGSYYYPNGTFYTGEVADNAPHGQGELHYPSGNVVVGQWQRGQPVGP